MCGNRTRAFRYEVGSPAIKRTPRIHIIAHAGQPRQNSAIAPTGPAPSFSIQPQPRLVNALPPAIYEYASQSLHTVICTSPSLICFWTALIQTAQLNSASESGQTQWVLP